MFNFFNHHSYTVAAIGLPQKYSKVFYSRQEANDYMYKVCRKYGITIREIWEDNHDKTYHCTKGVTFFIQRAM